ncbi:hypothetical protein BH10PLA1_BH10PLA1_14820 [soil metagenome]
MFNRPGGQNEFDRVGFSAKRVEKPLKSCRFGVGFGHLWAPCNLHLTIGRAMDWADSKEEPMKNRGGVVILHSPLRRYPPAHKMPGLAFFLLLTAF